tara:strand:- start:105 stop:365 length:261 start_codon:yes stop_codon:yes gene_type:complete
MAVSGSFCFFCTENIESGTGGMELGEICFGTAIHSLVLKFFIGVVGAVDGLAMLLAREPGADEEGRSIVVVLLLLRRGARSVCWQQ